MKRAAFTIILCFSLLTATFNNGKAQIAQTPPMGWNSWDCFGVDLTESELKANADYMATYLKKYGWEYVVTDILWYGGPNVNIENFKNQNPEQRIDKYGRLIPAENRYPSAKNGSFKPVADYVHKKGLKFGIHVMRGIPWQAVEQNTPILGTNYHAQDIVAYKDTCIWYDGMYGVDMNKPGAQAYYNSCAELWAEWGVDYVKVDDISHPYHKAEIEAVSKALQQCGRQIVLSLSPGAAPRKQAKHLKKHANLWRISSDFWDDWKFLYQQFERCHLWQDVGEPGSWPDADMLPLGKLRKRGPDDYVAQHMGVKPEEITDEYSHFTDTEKQTLMTLWCIFRSPLMLGGHLPENDDKTFELITNEQALLVNQHSENNHQVYRKDPKIVWAADVPGSNDKYVALFNVHDHNTVKVDVSFELLEISGPASLYDLWAKKKRGVIEDKISTDIPPHGAKLYRIIIEK